MKKRTLRFLFVVLVTMPMVACSQSAVLKTAVSANEIRINQLGFYPGQPKIAVLNSAKSRNFILYTADKKKKVFEGRVQESVLPGLNGKRTQIADFSAFDKTGEFVLFVEDTGYSHPFSIQPGVFKELARASAKAFYYQRASTDLPETYAGKWHRIAGHPDDKVLVHPSAATESRAAGFMISAPGGWYDAGDYNKYIVNSGISMGTLLSLYEDFPVYVRTMNLNIPESKNNIPDLLDEILWNLRWMFAMQDPEDGGVYHKLTNAAFDGIVTPDFTKDPRYVVQKGTAATLDFAAVTAQASRLFKKFEKELPGLADSCLEASLKAWNWAQKNPAIVYDQTAMNRLYQPEISTGGYGDKNFDDEFIWAACELFITTGEEKYYTAVNMYADERMPMPSWPNVRLLGYYSLLRNQQVSKNLIPPDISKLKERMLTMANDLVDGVNDRAYKTVMGKSAREFGWGSNSVAANQAIALIQAYRLSADKKYLDGAVSNLDYLLGRNATGYSYVTGYGSKTPMFPHHRPSLADRTEEPVPGLLVGGPNPGKQDGVALPSSFPDEAYIDHPDSYATNEIAINWNAPLVYLVWAIEALQYTSGYSEK